MVKLMVDLKVAERACLKADCLDSSMECLMVEYLES